jgi:Zn-dependent M28 family amino/carboxypeptidase
VNSLDDRLSANLGANLRDHLDQIVRPRDPYLARSGHFFVKIYIRQQLSQFGTVTLHPFEQRGQTHENLILQLPSVSSAGQRPPILPPILIGAHYDTVPGTPGADDNATGLAVLLELARHFARHPARFPLWLVAFDLEEYGLLGSRAYAQHLKDQGQPLRLMLSLECLGYTAPSQRYPAFLHRFYPATGDFIALVGNLSTIPDLIRVRGTMGPHVPCQWLPAGWRGNLVPDTRRSDHAPFWDLGYRAMMVTDTAELRNPHYHRPSDRLETLDLPFLTGVCQGLIGAIAAL